MQDTEDWKIGLRAGLDELMDQAVVAGARPDDIFGAISDELKAMKAARERDPDPAEEMLEEPANDWPAADR